jgi:hypothetical protein
MRRWLGRDVQFLYLQLFIGFRSNQWGKKYCWKRTARDATQVGAHCARSYGGTFLTTSDLQIVISHAFRFFVIRRALIQYHDGELHREVFVCSSRAFAPQCFRIYIFFRRVFFRIFFMSKFASTELF